MIRNPPCCVRADRAAAVAVRTVLAWALAATVVLLFWAAAGAAGGPRAVAWLLAVPADPWLVAVGAASGDPVPLPWVVGGCALSAAAVAARSRLVRSVAALGWGLAALFCVAYRHLGV